MALEDMIPGGQFVRGYLEYAAGAGAVNVPMFNAEGVSQLITGFRLIVTDLVIGADAADTIIGGFGQLNKTTSGTQAAPANVLVSIVSPASGGIAMNWRLPMYLPLGQNFAVKAVTANLRVSFTGVLIKS